MTRSIPGVIDGMYGNTTGMNTITSSGGPVDNRMMSRLPVVNQPWPPPEYEPVSYMHRIWDAWWTGDRQQLAWVYYNLGANSPVGRSFFSSTGERGMPTPRPGQFRGGLLGSIEYSFWGTPTPPGEKRTRSHVPIGGDIAQTSASLLFSKPPVIRSSLQDKKAAALNNAWYDTLIDDPFHRRLLEGGEMCSALGGVYGRVVWDTEVREKPWIVCIPADVGVPLFSYDILKAVTFWQVLADDGDDVLRHLEMHVPSQNAIFHGLYHGNQTDLGERIPMDAHPTTKAIAMDPNVVGDAIVFPDQPLDASSVVYVPNLTPNRVFRDLGPQAWPIGRSDFCGVENLMDNLDEVYSSWIRDVRLAKMRLIVPPQYLDNIGRGKGAVWEPERQVFSPLNMLHDDNASNITANQFTIRWQEHKSTCDDLVQRIVEQAGYSSQTFGDYEQGSGGAMTATEINMRERLTMMTRAKKINMWRSELANIIYSLMVIERQNFGNTLITPERPNIEFVETIGPDITVLASTAQALENAGAASKRVLVQLVHPDWSPEQVDEEVTAIFEETGAELASRARIALSAPMGEDLGQEINQLAQMQPVAPVRGAVPGDNPNEPSTGGADPNA